MFPTRQAPDARAGEAPIIEAYDLAGADGEDAIDATDGRERRWYHLRPKPRRPTDVLGFDLVDGPGMASPDRRGALPVPLVVVT